MLMAQLRAANRFDAQLDLDKLANSLQELTKNARHTGQTSPCPVRFDSDPSQTPPLPTHGAPNRAQSASVRPRGRRSHPDPAGRRVICGVPQPEGRPQLNRTAPAPSPSSGESPLPDRRECGFSRYGVEGYDWTDEDRAFIDDGGDGNDEWRRALRDVTRYDPASFADDGDVAVASAGQIYAEERRSSKIAANEDAAELRRIEEEAMQERASRKRRRQD
eukprot:Polyplicarium_translucidae@DN2187_c0_g1_i2.p2